MHLDHLHQFGRLNRLANIIIHPRAQALRARAFHYIRRDCNQVGLLIGGEMLPDYLRDFQTIGEQPGAGQPTPGLARGPRNAIVIVCESVGTQQLSLYGGAFKTWPRRFHPDANNSMRVVR